MILLVASEKGGVGKTTIATNLAANLSKSSEVMLIDSDPLASAADWTKVRDEILGGNNLYCTQIFGNIKSEVLKLTEKFENLIIDAGGRDSKELRTGMLVATKMIIPVQASQFDTWALSRMDELVGRAKEYNDELDAIAVINRGPTNPSIKEVEQAQKIFVDLEHITLAKTVIRERKPFRDAAKKGLSVTELKLKDPKASTEIMNLYREVYNAS